MNSLREQLFSHVRNEYGCDIEFPWRTLPDAAVFRHAENKKWYGLVMEVGRDKLGLPGTDPVDVLNIKIEDSVLREMQLRQPGCFPGYHMNHFHWMTVMLDGTVPFADICMLLDRSYEATLPKRLQAKERLPREWVIPSNPHYYDVITAFRERQEIEWKQGRGILKGDTVYLYVGAPVSAILYKCLVTETGIPYDRHHEKITINALMRIRCLKTYPADQFTFARLYEEFDIHTIRGPRGIPDDLSLALSRAGEKYVMASSRDDCKADS
ncbi:MAG: MmcQ/YjbR family DNA-binding protein [Firmicutes bacterium]|nr:MmcQ/YjbR family DNA-binding protein [Bacillota bacterium]